MVYLGVMELIPGSCGPTDISGCHVTNRKPGKYGGILHPLRGSVLYYESATRYDVKVTDFTVTSALDDGIFEPNEQILIFS